MVEIIYKVKPGVYLVVNFARVDATSGMLFVNWGRFWDRITNETLQLQKVEKCCPVLYEVLNRLTACFREMISSLMASSAFWVLANEYSGW